MKLSRVIPICLGVLSSTVSLASGAPAANARYTVLEDSMVFTDMGTWFAAMDGSKLYFHDMVMTAYDHGSDPRVTGQVTLKMDGMWDPVYQLGPLWAQVWLENANGSWEGWCVGKREFIGNGPDVLSSFEGTMEGKGAYKGLVARYSYFGTNVSSTGVLLAKGYIIDRGIPYRPVKGTAERTEEAKVILGAFVKPDGSAPPVPGYILEWTVNDVAVSSHAGKGTLWGTGFLLPATGTGTGYGLHSVANGDMANWIVQGAASMGETPHATIHMAGGTGHLGAITGAMEVNYQAPNIEPAPIMRYGYSYDVHGALRY